MSRGKERIRAEQISLLFRNSTIGFTASVFMGALLCLILFPHIPVYFLLTWFLSLLTITAIRFLLTLHYQKADTETLNLRKWETLFLLTTGLSGVVWGASILFLFPADSSIHQFLILLFLAGMMGGSVGVFSPLMLAFLSFTLPITLSVSLKFILIGDIFSITIAISIWVFFISMALATRHSEQAIRNALVLSFDNEALKHEIAARKLTEEKLQNSQNRYQELVENMSDGVAVLEPVGEGKDFVFKEYNRVAERIGKIQREKVIGQSVRKVFPGVVDHGLIDVFQQVWYSDEPKHHPVSHYQDKHLNLWLETYIFKLPDGAIAAIYSDITELKKTEEQLHLAATVFSHAKEGIMIAGTDGTIIEVNNAFQQLTGYTRDEVLGKKPSILSSGQHGPEFYVSMWHDINKNGYWSGDIWNKRKNGDIYIEKLTISAVHDTKGNIQHYVGLFYDITNRIKLEKQLKHIAYHDTLTNLPNRVLFADRLNQAMIQAQRKKTKLAIVYLDLDNFKPVNDKHNHQTGDQLLVITANRMEQALREGDTIARIGGDEFVAILIDFPGVDDGEVLLNRLLTAVTEPVYIQNLVLQVSTSMGVTFYPQKEDIDADQLLRQADQAMYQAKLSGKNRYHYFDSEQDNSIRGHHQSVEQIRQAIVNQEFLLYYQPKVNMSTGKVIGAEALIRWQHPEQGLLPPAQFLPAIAEHPVAVELGNWVLKTAISQLETWLTGGSDIAVSVNIEAYHLQHPDFIKHLQSLLTAHPDVRPSNLELEILESSALKDINHVSQIMKNCQKIGVSFALDDFGTGYSSLTYLKRLPANTLKIDQTFVRNMLDEPKDIAILESVLGLSVAFQRQAIAEGVETVEHGELLLQLGCELAQGYAISRPVPADKLPKWIANWQTYSSWKNQRQIRNEDLSLLYAATDHRAWIRQIENHIRYEHSPPPFDQNECRFGQWLNTEGYKRYRTQAPYQSVLFLHNKVHTLGMELCKLNSNSQKELATNKLEELKSLRDELLKNQKELIQIN